MEGEQPALEEMGPPPGLHGSGPRPEAWSPAPPPADNLESWGCPSCISAEPSIQAPAVGVGGCPLHEGPLGHARPPFSPPSPQGEEAEFAGVALVLAIPLRGSCERQRKATKDEEPSHPGELF